MEQTAQLELRVSSLEGLMEVFRGLSEEEFVSRVPDPVLLQEDAQSPIEVDGRRTMGLCYLPTQTSQLAFGSRKVVHLSSDSQRSVLTLGRSLKNDVVLDDPSVSSSHATLRVAPQGDKLEVLDCGSKNGSIIQGKALDRGAQKELRSSDLVSFGRLNFRFLSPRDLYRLLWK